ncbi:MAG: hypothetical protein AAFP85_18330 [Pseudomonadota bacterium]
MADPKNNTPGITIPLVPIERGPAITVADGDSPVTHIAGQPAEANEKSPPPLAKKPNKLALFLSANKNHEGEEKKSSLRQSKEASHPAGLDDRDDTMKTDKQTATGLSKLRAFMATTPTSVKSDADSVHGDGSVIDEDVETVADHDATDTGVRPEPLGTLGRPAPFHAALQRKVDDLAAKQIRDEALNGPPTFTLGNGMKVGGDMARHLQAFEDSRPENMFKKMGGISATPSVKERVDGINATPDRPVRLPPKPVMTIPERDNAFDLAKGKFDGSAPATSTVDRWRLNNPVDVVRPQTSVQDMIANLQPKKQT